MTKENDSDIFQDERFAHIKQDPRFQKMPRLERKVKIDKRFQGMFRDQRFKEKYTVDKRGRPVNLSTNEDLRKYYELSDSSSSDEEEEGEEEERKKKITKSKKKKLVKDTAAAVKDQKTSKNSLKVGKKKVPKQRLQIHSKVNQNDTLSVRAKTKLGKKQSSEDDDSIDLARGKGNIETSSEDDDDSNDLARGKGNIETSSEDDDSIDLDRGKGNIETSSEDDDDSIDLARGKGNIETSSEEEEDDESSSDEEGGTGELNGNHGDSSKDSDDEEFEFEDEIEIEHKWGELDADAGSTTEATCRLAVCNMDWDRIKANDLLIMFNSFKPTGGIIKSVKIYPSEFGKERMKEEDLKGPKELVENAKKYFDDEDDEKYQTERLRHYQMQRLKYYYAVVECDSPTTANTIYEQCDRMEYESSATQLDLRFIPEDMEFEDVPTSVSSENVDIATFKPTSFISSALQQTQVHLTWDETNRDRLALTTKKFDKDEVMKLDVQDYLASSSDEEGNQGLDGLLDLGSEGEEDDTVNEEDQITKYKALLKELDKTDDGKVNKEMEMEITWEPGLKETTEELFKKKDQNEEMTAWQQYQKNKKEKKKEKKKEEEVKKKQIKQQQTGYLSDDELPADVDLNDEYFKEALNEGNEKTVSKDARKKRKKKRKEEELTAEELEEKKQKEAELELLLMDEDDDKQHFSLKAIIDSEKQKKKRRKKKKVEDEKLKFQDNFEVDAHDPRFSAIYESHHYQIDPSDPHFKKTKAMDVIIQEKQRRREKEDKSTKVRLQEKAKEGNVKSGGQDKRVLSMLVKSVKNKTDEFNARKSKKLKLK